MLFSHLRLGFLNVLAPSSFFTKSLYVFLFSYILPTCPTHIFLMVFGGLYK
jgi:hypothetical protein